MFSTYIIAQYTPMGNGELIQHNYLSLSYIESHEQAEWVYYTITTVPGYYYKVIYQPATKQMIGFVLPNEKLSKSLSAFILSVDSIEALTGIDFFHQLDTKLQTQLESFPGDISDWTKGSDTSVSQSKNKGVTSSSQCKGVTKSTGGPCKSKTTKLNGYCHYHQKQAK